MPDNEDNFGSTKVVGEDGGQMDSTAAGIDPPRVPTMEGDAADASTGDDMEDDDAGTAEMKALDEETGEADVTASGAE